MVRMVQNLLWTSLFLIRLVTGTISISTSGQLATFFTITATVTTSSSSCLTGDSLSLTTNIGSLVGASSQTIASGTTSYTFNFYCTQPGSMTLTAACAASDSGTAAITVGIGTLTISGSVSVINI